MKNLFTMSLLLTIVFIVTTANASEGEKLYKSKPCAACHTLDSKMVGPGFKEVAIKNVGVKGATEILAEKIKNGSSGDWGPIPMPPNPVTEDEAKILAEWILSLK